MHVEPIGFITTPYSQKFGIPRQPALARSVEGTIHFTATFNDTDYLRGIDQFSHLWLLFAFHEHLDRPPTALVRPPRLGGNSKIGVFASRSSFRPNPIGQSLVEYKHHRVNNGALQLTVAGIDLLDGTPILDIKPYIPYADSVANAQAGYADTPPGESLSVAFSDAAQQDLLTHQARYPSLKSVIELSIAQDPRPAYKARVHDDKIYTLRLYHIDIRWHVDGTTATVISLKHVS
ncbi:tRNA (N6-threonylcarbamoyladenosine(37)-N6)-methyltransferase TrmO [Alteromonas oceanisediminis]|uniref:tRNA (N6-threonylcarbamoyladenosine(37)-N6)-methyltransferase TrmO n=1 Tax=Alteromonas oceanisediminis TaxID=2836180 RepID=UPI001BD9298E|nr:tRNA (N6-threonylcarbamoyladenosine(37)-N6)-methyltransferase TrmO [Alteromonas oceanisediminis]MBT0585752.1 tRNA (N6-threonylcarbamoyladenosine(37)-N6)-methyltransferase TrmO [Alteromonas oceanisediminis]